MKKTKSIAAVTTLAAAIALPAIAKDLTADRETKAYELKDTRNYRFCEMIVIGPKWAEAYNTSASNECPPDQWNALDNDALSAEFESQGMLLNGPKYWMMDSQVVRLGGTQTFGGIEAQWAATLPSAGLSEEGGNPYEVFKPNKIQKMVYDAGKKVYEIVDAEGHAYVLQARGPQFNLEDLETMGDQMKNLPEGWSYRVRVLEKDLVLDLDPAKATIYAVGDEFYQYYTRPPTE